MKYIKTLLLGAFAFMFLIGGAQSAAASWNTMGTGCTTLQDCALVRVKNLTQNSGQASTYVNANPGDTVMVILYYHNTGSNTESGRFTLSPMNTNSGTSHTFSGTFTAPSANLSGSATVNTSQAVTLTYIPGSVAYYRYNQGSSTTPFPGGQSGAELFSGGVTIDSIPGMNTCPISNQMCQQGTVIAQFRVSQATQQTYACNDGQDNDGDGKIDSLDPGCYVNGIYVPTLTSEYNYIQTQQQCQITSFYPSQTNVTSGSTFYLYWQTNGYCTNLTVDGYTYPVNGSGTFGPLYSGRSYVASAYGSNGSDSKSTYVGVNTIYYNNTYACSDNIDNDNDGRIDMNDPGCTSSTDPDEYNYTQPVNTQNVYTGVPTNITQTSARLNGTLTQYSGYTTQVYFKWGLNQNVVNTTSAQSINTSNSFFDTLPNLAADTVYYYKAVANSNGNIVEGDLQIFKTNSLPTVITNPGNPVVITRPVTTTVIERGIGIGSNLVSMRSDNRTGSACVLDNAEYTFFYKNISEKAITDAVIQIALPKDFGFSGSSAGIYNNVDNTLTINVGSLQPQQEQSVSVRGIVKESARDRDLLVATATMSFTNPYTNATESAVAYGLINTNNCTKETSSLAGLALFGTGFLPGTLLGWLLLFLVILGLILLARRLWTPVYIDRRHADAPHIDDLNLGTSNGYHR